MLDPIYVGAAFAESRFVNNQRQHERIDISLAVVIVHEGKELALRTQNISSGGMLITGGTELPYGAAVNIRMTLPSGDIDVPATVRWVRDGVVGVQFGSMRAKDTWALHQILKGAQPKK